MPTMHRKDYTPPPPPEPGSTFNLEGLTPAQRALAFGLTSYLFKVAGYRGLDMALIISTFNGCADISKLLIKA